MHGASSVAASEKAEYPGRDARTWVDAVGGWMAQFAFVTSKLLAGTE